MQRLLLVAMMLANKYLDDLFYSNKQWAKIGGNSLKKITARWRNVFFKKKISCFFKTYFSNVQWAKIGGILSFSLSLSLSLTHTHTHTHIHINLYIYIYIYIHIGISLLELNALELSILGLLDWRYILPLLNSTPYSHIYKVYRALTFQICPK